MALAVGVPSDKLLTDFNLETDTTVGTVGTVRTVGPLWHRLPTMA